MNTGGQQEYNEHENPFAFTTERPGAGRTNYTNAGNSFNYFNDETTVNVPGGGSNFSASVDKRLIKLRLWNTALRIATFVLCLAAVILIVSNREKNSDLQYDGKSSEATYHFSGSFVFFLYANVAVAMYALALSIAAFVVGRKGEGRTTPVSMMWPALVLNVVHATFLILAFAVALAVEVVSKNGVNLGSIRWAPICPYYSRFCTINEIALAASGAAYLCLLTGTCIDAYCIHVFS